MPYCDRTHFDFNHSIVQVSKLHKVGNISCEFFLEEEFASFVFVVSSKNILRKFHAFQFETLTSISI